MRASDSPVQDAIDEYVKLRKLQESIAEWNALPWWRRLWYWAVGAPEAR